MMVWLPVLWCSAIPPAVAQQPSQRERELEDLVRKLSQKVDQLESRLNGMDGGPVDPETTARVEKLEQTVEEIKESQPPSVDSEEWKKMRKWVTDSAVLRPYWKDGLRFDSNDGSVKLKLGGRIQNDYALFCEEGDLERRIGDDFEDGTEFRRARIYFSGTIYDNIDFKVQYDFAGGDSDFKDVYLGLSKIPVVGNLKIGQFKEPFSLEELTSSNYITFMERSLVNTFAPGRATGAMIHNTMLDQRMTWAAGAFFQADDFGDSTANGDYDITARITGLPWYEDEGRKLLHLGAAMTHRNFDDDMIRIRARPEAHLAPRVVDTGRFSAEYADIIGGELAWVHGPFSLQGEYVKGFYEGRSRWTGDPTFSAASVQASYFLTGEHRPYKRSAGAFDRVKPKKNWGKDGGPGAWELAARYSWLDLSDAGVEGGRLNDITLGVNWYLNPNVRTMWNYIWADPSQGGEVSALMWRFQVAF